MPSVGACKLLAKMPAFLMTAKKAWHFPRNAMSFRLAKCRHFFRTTRGKMPAFSEMPSEMPAFLKNCRQKCRHFWKMPAFLKKCRHFWKCPHFFRGQKTVGILELILTQNSCSDSEKWKCPQFGNALTFWEMPAFLRNACRHF